MRTVRPGDAATRAAAPGSAPDGETRGARVPVAGPRPWRPAPFQVVAKPIGPTCDLACAYCYYRPRASRYAGARTRMDPATLEAYVRQTFAATAGPVASFVWQGGEPTLLGTPFFEGVVALQRKLAPPGMRAANALQTHGLHLDDDWCAFLRQHDFLVGVSLDGPPDVHDGYRVDAAGRPSHARVLAGVRRLQVHGVAWNVLTTVHAANQDQGLRVYQYLRDHVGAEFVQFIPIVERSPVGSASAVTKRSVDGAAYGRFLSSVFDEWVRRDIGSVFVRDFDVALANALGERPGFCVHEPTCGRVLVLEHDGEVYACDHFVNDAHRLGNVREVELSELVEGERQRAFGRAKRDALPTVCRTCPVRTFCHGGCPKDRLATTVDGEAGLNYLCPGYREFFTHTAPAFALMAREIHLGRPPANVMASLAGGGVH